MKFFEKEGVVGFLEENFGEVVGWFFFVSRIVWVLWSLGVFYLVVFFDI